VIGVGLNVRTPAVKMSTVDQAWTDLESALGTRVSRNALATHLLCQIIYAVKCFEREGLAPFMAEWARWDALAGHEISLDLPAGKLQGIARGIDESGALLLAHNGKLQRHHSGEVSVRLATKVAGSALSVEE